MPHAEPVAAVPSDAALIAAWQGGDEQAAAELVRRHARALARFLGAGSSGGDADVDDLVQETFIRAFRALGQFRGQCRFRTWLMTIGGNVLKDAYRRVKRARVVPLADELRDKDGDPHEHAVAGEMEARLAEGLGRLPRMQRGEPGPDRRQQAAPARADTHSGGRGPVVRREWVAISSAACWGSTSQGACPLGTS